MASCYHFLWYISFPKTAFWFVPNKRAKVTKCKPEETRRESSYYNGGGNPSCQLWIDRNCMCEIDNQQQHGALRGARKLTLLEFLFTVLGVFLWRFIQDFTDRNLQVFDNFDNVSLLFGKQPKHMKNQRENDRNMIYKKNIHKEKYHSTYTLLRIINKLMILFYLHSKVEIKFYRFTFNFYFCIFT